MERYLKAIVPTLATFISLLMADSNLIDALSTVWEAITISLVEGGIIWATPNINYKVKTVRE